MRNRLNKIQWFVKNTETGEYLVWRSGLFQIRKGYFWKKEKGGASFFDRKIADKIIMLIKGTGVYTVKRIRVKK